MTTQVTGSLSSDILDDDFRPSAARLVESLRDTGYCPEAAFADVIDNAIAAKATNVRVELSSLFGEVRVAFIDNGEGMTEEELRSAMRYGSPKRPDPKSLGKFGMGLKTASTAFCERLTVISIKNHEAAIRVWDIDTIRKTDKWHLETPDWSNYLDEKQELEQFSTATGSATMVIWEKVDRLITLGSEERINSQLQVLGKELGEELSAVFARFLDHSDLSVPNITLSMRINGAAEQNLKPWNPLCLELNKGATTSRVQVLPTKKITATLPDNSEASFTITGSILPTQGDLTTDELDRVRYSLDNQGFYIYREGRLIWHEGWPPRMYKKEGKMTRLRVVLDFTHELDDLFKIDFRKSRIIIPPVVRDKLKEIVAPWRNHTLRTSTSQERDSVNSVEKHQRAANAIDRHREQTRVAKVTIENGKAKLQNKFNIHPIEVNGFTIYQDTGVRVREEDSLDGNVLWSGALDNDGEICLQLGRSHPYFARLYATCKDNPDAIMALDMLLWGLANAELGIWSESNKIIIREFRQQVSSSLNFLCQELPDPSDD
jgi:hypothetical protein